MKRFILSILIALPILVSAQSARFAVVDEKAVLESMPDYIFVERQLFKTSQKYHAEYDKMSAEIDKKFEDFQILNEQNAAPQAIRERRIQEIQNLQKRAQQFLETAEEDLVRQQRELIDPIKQRLKNCIKEIGTEQGFTFIFPADSPLFTGIEVEDLTDQVKEKINAAN